MGFPLPNSSVMLCILVKFWGYFPNCWKDIWTQTLQNYHHRTKTSRGVEVNAGPKYDTYLWARTECQMCQMFRNSPIWELQTTLAKLTVSRDRYRSCGSYNRYTSIVETHGNGITLCSPRALKCVFHAWYYSTQRLFRNKRAPPLLSSILLEQSFSRKFRFNDRTNS